jgi:hypothetical protein
MFSKISRYRKLPDETVVDAHGRVLPAKSLRLLPDVTGTFRHTVTANDRLDHLAFTYYSQPRKWWRICDANPYFLSPLALLGSEVIQTTAIPLVVPGGGEPPWAALFSGLRATQGVEGVQISEEVALQPRVVIVTGQQVTILVEQVAWVAFVTYNSLQVTPGALADVVTAAGLAAMQPADAGQIGQLITIPPDVVG